MKWPGAAPKMRFLVRSAKPTTPGANTASTSTATRTAFQFENHRHKNPEAVVAVLGGEVGVAHHLHVFDIEMAGREVEPVDQLGIVPGQPLARARFLPRVAVGVSRIRSRGSRNWTKRPRSDICAR